MLNGAGRGKNFLLAAALALWMLGGGVAITKAGAPDDCAKRIQKAEDKLRKEIDKHGEHSPQADQKRRDLDEVRRQCGGDRH